MADPYDTAMAAQLGQLLRGGQKRDPFALNKKVAADLIAQGSQTTPVLSEGEGWSRLGTGAIGGLTALAGGWLQGGYDKATKEQLGTLLAANSPDELATAMKGATNVDPDTMAPIISSILIGKQRDWAAKDAANRTDSIYAPGGGQPGAAGPSVAPGAAAPGAPVDPNAAAATGPPASLAPTSGQAAGFANNLGNITASNAPFADKGAPVGRFETFATPQAGANAMTQNLAAYAQKNPNMTVAQAIATWAPPNENNTQLYIQQFAERTGINPGMRLADVLADPAMAAQALEAMTVKEKGGYPRGVSADTFSTATGTAPGVVAAVPASTPPGVVQNPPGASPIVPVQAQAPGAVAPSAPGATAPPAATSASVAPMPLPPRPAPDPAMVQQQTQLRNAGVISNADMIKNIEADRDNRWKVTIEEQRRARDEQLKIEAENRAEGRTQAKEVRTGDTAEFKTQRAADDRAQQDKMQAAGFGQKDIDRAISDRHRAEDQTNKQAEEQRKEASATRTAAATTLATDTLKNYTEKQLPKARDAADSINSFHATRQLLDQGAFTGPGSGLQATGARLAEKFGLDWGADAAANRTALNTAIGQRVLATVKQLGAGTGISNADREYAEKMQAGVDVGEAAMRRVIDAGERDARRLLANHETETKRVRLTPGLSAYPDEFFASPPAPTYAQWRTDPANAPLPKAGENQPAAPAPTQGGGWTAEQMQQMPRPATPQDAARLPRGTTFVDGNGQVRTVP